MLKLAHLIILGTLALPSGVMAAGAEPIGITAQSLSVQQAQGTAQFNGQVKVVQGTLTLTANTLNVRFSTSLDELTATGNVKLVRGTTESASGAQAVFNPQLQTLVLTGPRVTLQRGPSLLVGDKLVYNLATEEAKLTNQGGPVQATFTPNAKP